MQPTRPAALLAALLLASAPLAAQTSDAQARDEIAFARGLAAEWGFVDLAQEVIADLEQAGVSKKVAEEVALAKCAVYFEGGKADRTRRSELLEQALAAYRDFVAGHSYSELLPQAESGADRGHELLHALPLERARRRRRRGGRGPAGQAGRGARRGRREDRRADRRAAGDPRGGPQRGRAALALRAALQPRRDDARAGQVPGGRDLQLRGQLPRLRDALRRGRRGLPLGPARADRHRRQPDGPGRSRRGLELLRVRRRDGDPARPGGLGAGQGRAGDVDRGDREAFPVRADGHRRPGRVAGRRGQDRGGRGLGPALLRRVEARGPGAGPADGPPLAAQRGAHLRRRRRRDRRRPGPGRRALVRDRRGSRGRIPQPARPPLGDRHGAWASRRRSTPRTAATRCSCAPSR